jgi:hypothetical protein
MSHVVLNELSTDRCWALLRTAEIGRIAWSTSRGPEIFPVNLAVDGHTVYMRTRVLSAMAQKVDAERVAIEVDRIDEDAHTGWSVRARGLAEVRFGAFTDAPDLTPWPEGPRSAIIAVVIDEIDGRRLDDAATDDREDESR